MDYFKKKKMKMMEDEEMNPIEKEAKMGVLSSMKASAKPDLMEKLKKVSVMSDSPEGLKMGLDKAKDMVEAKSDMEMEHPEYTAEEIDKMIEELLEKKKLLEGKFPPSRNLPMSEE